ncbi:hypothetical protein ACFY94_20820 [Streptomyces griseorubiginosus]|uniref:hypothetical protein n=1 Tax=Streptomyces griseorubiginosus TaxID=67304 RepID=UPI0036EB60F0
MLGRTSTTARYTRGFAAAVVAVATLVLAANAGPAKAAGEQSAERTHQVEQVIGHTTGHTTGHTPE